ncbi:flagellar hook-associated protein FlgK [Rhizobium sp. RM]|uniref:flagellar hook-associated protein FlgK n=1 Tax=Rhizobium sp. RM TaxID=2748079 RepID=UPI00110F5AC3|nr:flagellar hook-associated protein FlgK [Rhizobium sp. RM]NWJ24882.1 flagellar hook-associated protein FlgK [Rhizobium sp. RM]TMV16669.1 flagellar hook-associated protein FlgK [Rhizobium sp. Td3]
MSLMSAMNTAQSIFNNTGKQTEVTSKNIANVGNANYVKRTAILGTTMYGANIVTNGRAQNESLLRQTIASSSLASGQSTVLGGLEEMKSIFGGNDYESSPATYMSALLESLEGYAAKPSDSALAATAVTSAIDVANSLNKASQELQSIRLRADKEIVLQVDKLNSLLSDFETANNAVKGATASGRDPSDALDQRDALLKEISTIVGVSVVTRDNNDIALYTSQGTTLFETIPRKVTFTPQTAYDANTTGNSIFIDGVAVKAGDGSNTTAAGSLAGLLQIRDDYAPTMQSQLDETARGLITMFAEKPADSTSGLPDMPGLFTYGSPLATTIPADGTVSPGLAASITVNPALIISQGGNPELLRDGGINGTDYVINTSGTGGTGLSKLIDSYVTAFDAPMNFDASTRIDTNTSILKYGTNSMGWLEQERSGATSAYEAKSALYERSSTSYSNNTAVSLDEELSLLLDIEQSYKAATKLVSTIDEMLQSLMDMAR